MEKIKQFRILFIAKDKFPPYRVDITDLFGDKITSRGHKIDWLLQSESDCNNSYQTEWNSGRVWVGKTDNGSSLFARIRKNIFNLVNDLNMFRLSYSQNYDFIQVRDKFIPAIFAIFASKLFGPRFIFWLSFPFPENLINRSEQDNELYPFMCRIRGKFFQFILYRIISKYAEHIFVQSDEMLKMVNDEGVPAHKLSAVPMGVSTDFFEDKCQSNDFNSKGENKHKKVLYLGTLNRSRKLEIAIRAFSKVLKVEPESKLYLVGDSDNPLDRKALESEASKLGIEGSIIFTGFLPRDDALSLVRESTICISPIPATPIFNVGSPTKLIEYMAMEKAVVANDHPEQKLIIEASHGGLCVDYSEDAFADAILYLLSHPQEAKKMGQQGKLYISKKRNYEKIADTVETEYRRIFSLT